jgi:hypothetical protein
VGFPFQEDRALPLSPVACFHLDSFSIDLRAAFPGEEISALLLTVRKGPALSYVHRHLQTCGRVVRGSIVLV